MKLLVTLTSVLVISLSGVWIWLGRPKVIPTDYSTYGYTNLTIEGKLQKLWIADTQEKWYRGLSYVTEKSQLIGKDGMVFEFGDKQVRSFVNRKTYVDLDVYWMNEGEVVGKDFLPKVKTNTQFGDVIVESKVIVNRVVEIVR